MTDTVFGRLQYYGTAAERAAFTPLFVWTQWLETDTNAVYVWNGSAWVTIASASGAVGGSGTPGRITEWTGVSTIGDSTLEKTGAGLLTLSAAAPASLAVTGASSIEGAITGGGTVATGGFVLTIPTTGTAALGAGTLTYATTNDATIADHTHAITSSANPGIAESLLKSDANGYLQLERIGLGITPAQLVHAASGTTVLTLEAAGVMRIVADTGNAIVLLERANDNAALETNITMRRSRGTIASKTAVQNGDSLGRLQWVGYYSPTNLVSTAFMRAIATGNYALNSYGSKIVFGVTVTGAATAVSPVTISETGLGVFTDPASRLHALLVDTATTTASTLQTMDHNTSGTPVGNNTTPPGYGSAMLWRLESGNNTVDQNAGLLTIAWEDATHASRSSYMSFSTYYTSTAREGLRFTATVTGSYATFGGGLRVAGAIKSADYTLTSSDCTVVFTATATATLPAATGSWQTYRIICRAGTLNIEGNGSDTIKGELTQTLTEGEDLIITDTAAGLWE